MSKSGEEAREAAAREIEAAIQPRLLHSCKHEGCAGNSDEWAKRIKNILSRHFPPTETAQVVAYIHEDELPSNMPKEDYDKWFAQSWIPDGVGCRVGPRYPFEATQVAVEEMAKEFEYAAWKGFNQSDSQFEKGYRHAMGVAAKRVRAVLLAKGEGADGPTVGSLSG
jgi:hypothetical protein